MVEAVVMALDSGCDTLVFNGCNTNDMQELCVQSVDTVLLAGCFIEATL